ncbi:MAG: hypothetical protein ACJAZ8_002873 [Planctomycetota bacterium]|jgi:hypothetical protein
MMDGAGFSVGWFGIPRHETALGFHKSLVPEAYSKHGQRWGSQSIEVQAHASILGKAGTRTDDDGCRGQGQEGLWFHGVVAVDLDPSAMALERLCQVEGEGVVVVDE